MLRRPVAHIGGAVMVSTVMITACKLECSGHHPRTPPWLNFSAEFFILDKTLVMTSSTVHSKYDLRHILMDSTRLIPDIHVCPFSLHLLLLSKIIHSLLFISIEKASPVRSSMQNEIWWSEIVHRTCPTTHTSNIFRLTILETCSRRTHDISEAQRPWFKS